MATVTPPALSISSGISADVGNNGIVTADYVLIYFTCGRPVPAHCLNTGQAGAYLDLENNSASIVNAQAGGPYEGLTIIYDRHHTSPLPLGKNASGAFRGTVYTLSAIVHFQNNGSSLGPWIIAGTADVKQNGSASVVGTQSLNNIPHGSRSLVR